MGINPAYRGIKPLLLTARTRKKNVAILIFDEIEVLDFAGPFEVFAVTNELHRNEVFNVVTFAVKPGTVRTRNGLKVIPEFTVDNCPTPHVLIIPGGAGTRPLLNQPSLLEWIRTKTRTADVVMSVCTGALLLAKAGLLDGLRATTHHENLADLAALAPAANVSRRECRRLRPFSRQRQNPDLRRHQRRHRLFAPRHRPRTRRTRRHRHRELHGIPPRLTPKTVGGVPPPRCRPPPQSPPRNSQKLRKTQPLQKSNQP